MGAGEPKLHQVDQYYEDLYKCDTNKRSTKSCERIEEHKKKLDELSNSKEQIYEQVIKKFEECKKNEQLDPAEHLTVCMAAVGEYYPIYLHYADPASPASDPKLAAEYDSLIWSSTKTICGDLVTKLEDATKLCDQGDSTACIAAGMYNVAVPICEDIQNNDGGCARKSLDLVKKGLAI